METKRYEFEHIVIDVVKNADKTMEVAGFKENDFGLIWMTPDKGKEHEVLGIEIFKVPEALEIFQRALENMQTAQGISEDYSDKD